jgi:hypothetical protein
MRIYLPATLPLLASWSELGEAPGGQAFAVTPGLREWYSDGDSEEMELAATVLAGREAIRLLARDDQAAPRRVVLAADVADGDVIVLDAEDTGLVRLDGVVPVERWGAIMVDDVDADTVRIVGRARTLVTQADEGDPDADLAVGDADDLDLLWWGVQEIDALLHQ